MPARLTVAIPTCHANDSDATLVVSPPDAPTLIFSDDPVHTASYTLAPVDGGAPVYRVFGGRRTELWRGNGTYVGAYARGLGGGTVDRAGGALKAGKWLVKAPRCVSLCSLSYAAARLMRRSSADPVLDMDLAPMQFTSGGETFVWYQHPGGSIVRSSSHPSSCSYERWAVLPRQRAHSVVHAPDDPHPRRHTHTCARDAAPRARRAGRRCHPVVACARASACCSGEPRVADIYGRGRRARRGGDRPHVACMSYGRSVLSPLVFALGRCVYSILDDFCVRSKSGFSPRTVVGPFSVPHRTFGRWRFRNSGSPVDGAYIVLFNHARRRTPM
jgi:hypothetical protein